IGGGIGGAIIGQAGTKAFASGAPGLLTLPIFYGPGGEGFVGLILGIVTAFVVSAVLTYILGFEDPVETDEENTSNETEETKQTNDEEIQSPLEGKIVELSNVPDQVFASEAMGSGIAIEPTVGRVVSPINGKVSVAF